MAQVHCLIATRRAALTMIANPVGSPAMPTQNVNLTPELDRFVKDEVSSGHFNNASEVHRAALSAMAREREERALRLERLRREIQLGIDDSEAGKVVVMKTPADLEAVMDGCLERAFEKLGAQNAETAE